MQNLNRRYKLRDRSGQNSDSGNTNNNDRILNETSVDSTDDNSESENSENHSDVKRSNSARKGTFQCKLCNKVFNTKITFVEHQRVCYLFR